MLLKRIIPLVIIMVFPFAINAQETNSSVTGIVKSVQGEPLVGATVTATHNPTGTVYRVATRTGGRFNLYNLRPGGPYTITVTYVGSAEEKKEDIYLNLGENAAQEFSLRENAATLTEVTVATRRAITSGKGGAESNIGRDKVTNMPTIGRNLNDFLRMTPQAKITGDGGVALAGQNNRYNAFFIDGANNSDIFGISAQGTNGGQAGISPISIDAIDQFQVILSPYDAQFGNFTGGGINATTKSGTNTVTGSIYYLFRNQNLAGRSPVAVPKPGSPSVLERTKLAEFKNKFYGFRIGGPLVKNKLFYFVSVEWQRDVRPQPFNIQEYRGVSSQSNIDSLANYIRTTYKYEPGGYLDNPEKVTADRIAVKIDWNINEKNKLSLSHRYNKGERFNTSTSSSTTINFYNDGYIFPSRTNSTSLELKSSFASGANNRLLITGTDVLDDRNPLGQPFPRVSIFDGTAGTIVFGTENFSAANKLVATNISVFDAFKFYKGKQVFTVGTDNEFNRAINTFIRDNFGTYTYNSLNDFYSGAKPRRYQRSFSLLDNSSGDNTVAAAKFRTMRVGFFVTDEMKINEDFTLTLSLRTDRTELLTKPREDKFFNDSAIAVISQYYDLKGARSGQVMNPVWLVSPRVGFTYRMKDENTVVRGGMGIFAGKVPLVWPGGIYNNNGISVGGVDLNPPASNLPFREDPFGQYTAQELGINISNARGQIDLVAKDFKLPTVFRTSIGIDKRLGEGWTFTTEGIFTKNIYEINYTNANILPPVGKSNGPDSRLVYTNSKIPLRSNGTNPYPGNVFLLSNSKGRKGYSYDLSFIIEKAPTNGLSFSASYTYGNSVVLNEGTSSQNNSQWATMETVNGRNNILLSNSDFDLGHRITAFVSKQIEYANKMLATRITLFYNGQSGNPYSYVYRNSPVNDNGTSASNDLIYIPTKADLAAMVFLSNTVNGITYSPQQQKDLLDQFIESDRYLKRNRGTFAERNGARLPFTHIVDLKFEQDFRLKIGSRSYELALTYDVSNFTNMLNKDWGRSWFLSFDQFSLVQFVSYVSPTNLTPQYRYNPFLGKPYGISTSVVPGSNARWLSQLGLRLNF